MATRDEALAEWERHQAQRKAQRERDANEARDREVKRALATLAKHGHQAGGEDVAALRAEHEEYRQAVVSLEEQRAELEQRLSVDHQAAELARLQGEIRQRDHRDAWREIARESGMHPKAVDAAWRNHGPKAESDEVDRKALESLCQRLKTEHGYLWPAEPTPEPAATPAARSEPTPAATNGVAGGFGHVFDRGSWRPAG